METKSKSFLETNFNVIIGLCFGLTANFIIVDYGIKFFELDSIHLAIIISGTAIIFSYVRIYLIRRYFDKKPDNWSPWRKIWKR